MKNFFYLILLSLVVALIINFTSISQTIYTTYFSKFKKQSIEQLTTTVLPELNVKLSSFSEFEFPMAESNDKIICDHEIVGEKNFTLKGGTIYIFALCVTYKNDKGVMIVSDSRSLPFAIKHSNGEITYKTIKLVTFSQDIKNVFPFYISPHLYVYSPDKNHPIIQKIENKIRNKWG